MVLSPFWHALAGHVGRWSLRRLGVTAREWDVGELLALGLGNKAVARRLHISPRTVEKHVSSLMTKTAAEHRDALGDVVRRIMPDNKPVEDGSASQ